jgi:hypothetical protein
VTAVPVDLDVRVVVLPLGQLANAVHEGQRLGEVPELVTSLQSAFNHGITRRRLH